MLKTGPMENAFKCQPRIFVVDDEPDIAKMLTVVLQMNQFDASSHTDPLAAFEAARAAPPEYLISDIVMPGMNGIELAINLQREIPSCKVLLFSGYDGAAELLEDAHASGHSFTLVEKPIHPKRLVAAILSLSAASGSAVIVTETEAIAGSAAAPQSSIL